MEKTKRTYYSKDEEDDAVKRLIRYAMVAATKSKIVDYNLKMARLEPNNHVLHHSDAVFILVSGRSHPMRLDLRFYQDTRQRLDKITLTISSYF